MKNLFLIQDKHDLNEVLKGLNLAESNIFLAINHVAYSECKKNNINPIILDDFFERDLHVSRRPESCNRNNIWINKFDSFLQDNVSEFKTHDFTPCRFSILGLYGFLDELYFAMNSLDNLFKNMSFDCIYLAKVEDFDFATWGRVFPRASLIPTCIEEIAKKYNKKLIIYNKENNLQIIKEANDTKFIKKISSYISPNLKRLIKLTINYSWTLPFKYFLSKLSKQNPVLFIGGGYDLSKLIKILLDRKIPVRIVEEPEVDFKDSYQIRHIQKKLLALEKKYEENKELNHPYGIESFSIPKALREKIIYRFMINIIPRLWSSYISLINNKKAYSLVLFWGFGEGVHPALAYACQKKNFTTAMYQHGGGSRSTWLTDYYQEATLVDYFLSYGEGINEIFQNLNKKFSDQPNKIAKLQSIGALRVSELNSTINFKKINKLKESLKNQLNADELILYIPNIFHYPSAHLNDKLLIGINYYKFLTKVIDLFKKNSSTGFIYKGFGTDLDIMKGSPIEDYINSMNSKNIFYTSNMPIASLMYVADKIILDHNQTTLNEVLQSGKEILLFDQGEELPWTINSEARNQIAENVHLSTNENDFILKIQKFISNELPNIKVKKSSAYFKNYSYFNDNPEIFDEEIYEKIRKIINK